MLKTYIHNLTIEHEEQTDLLTAQLKEVHQFLTGCLKRVERITAKQKAYDNYAYVHLNASNTLIIYANDQLNVKIQMYVYNSVDKELFDTVHVDTLIPIILDPDVQTRLDRGITEMMKQSARQMMFPDANKRLAKRAHQKKKEDIHRNNFIGWGR